MPQDQRPETRLMKRSQKRFVFFMMRRNSSSLTSPSPSRSASSIISCNSSSVIRSPSSFATLEILERYFARLVIVKEPECLQDFVLWIAVQDLVRHHLEKFLVLDSPTAIVVNVRNHFLDLFFLWL